MSDYDRKTFPLKDIVGAKLAGWTIERTPDGLIHENTPIPMKRLRAPMDRPLWQEDVA